MATFTWLPDYAPSPEQDIKVRRSVFGDGYEQRAESGINSIQPKWKLTFSKRTQLEAQAIQTWLTSNKAHVTAFNWAAPGEGVVSGETIMAGDGFRLTAQLTHLGRALTYTGTPTIYRTDWQGSQQLYPTARTNLWTYSGDLSNAAWVVVNSGTGTIPSVTANYAAAPDGTTTATRFVCARGAGATTSDYSVMSRTLIGTSGVTYSDSIWLKSNTGANQTIQLYFSGITGSTTSSTVTVTPVWQRFSIEALSTGTAIGIQFGTRGAGSDANVDFLAWGGDLKQGALSSYIPTTTSAVTVTDYTINASGLVTLAVAPVLNAVVMWSGTYTRKYIATWTPPTPEAFNSWSITAEFREVPA